MSLFGWCSRRAGGLSIVVLLALCYWVNSQESTHDYQLEQAATPDVSSRPTPTSGAGIWTLVFAYYCLLIHVLVNFFPLRACWSIWDLTQTLKRAARSKAIQDYKKSPVLRRGSQASVSSSETLTSDPYGGSTVASEASDVELDLYTDSGEKQSQDSVIFAIVIPNYQEEVDTLRETLDVLAAHPMARTSYDIYLGMEQREVNGESKALGLIQQFAKKFRAIDFTSHPPDIPGEAAGKGSNMAWAARKLSARYSMAMRKNVIVTGIDSDSHLSANYFSLITNMHVSHPETASTTLYSAPIIFDRNSHQVTAIVRVADILWCAAGMSGLYRGSSISPPTSVYSLPLVLVDRVGGWDCDGEAIGEDLHMYIKCFFALNGNLTCRVIPSPVSHCNVTGGNGGGIRGGLSDIGARYKQSLRHMWGALDTGFALRMVVKMWQERKHTVRVFRPLHRTHGDDADFYFPDSHDNEGSDIMRESSVFSDVTQDTIKEPHWENIFYLFHRLFEAHFMPVHMAVLVFASAIYVWVMSGRDDPNNLMWIFQLSNILRALGFMEMVIYMFLYESYHRVGLKAREGEMTRAGLADGMGFSHRTLKQNFVDYALVPVCATLYGTAPCLHAELYHFWTTDLVYTVSKKTTRQRTKSVTAADMA